MNFIRRNWRLLMIAAFFTLIAADLLARAGGAGGDSGSSSSSGGGDGGDIVIIVYLLIRLFVWIFVTLPFPINIIVIGAIIGVIVLVLRSIAKAKKESSVFNTISTGDSTGSMKGYSDFIKRNPDFNKDEFILKVKSAFTKIQTAWTEQNLGDVRRFISDGVYQRFNTQFKMMQLLQQKNILSNINIHNVFIDSAESDGDFDIIHVGIHASMHDKFECALDHSLDSSSNSDFVEFWSFIKKRSSQKKDLYTTANCPSCGAPQKALNEVCKCEYCGTFMNSGEYDWVLSEITQADDFAASSPKVEKARNLGSKVRELIGGNKDFSVQLVEDKVSNGYLQILTSQTVKDPAIMRRFVSDSLFEKLSQNAKSNQFVYNRLYLNYVTLIGVKTDETKNRLAVAVKSTFQRVKAGSKSFEYIDQAPASKTEVVIISRDKDASAAKGSIYAHICPACGGSLKDTIDVKCQYCGNVLNSTKNEWIIEDIISTAEYSAMVQTEKTSFELSVNPKHLDALYDSRDFALNNLIVLAMADGVYQKEEEEFVRETAKNLGYNLTKISGLLALAQTGALSIKMPEDEKSRRKIYSLMKKIAEADGDVSAQEQAVLDQVKRDYLPEATA
ncbi:MAG: TIM44-like domain-containing protein [Spirochaetes bacterium]|nr:TIM44-like domain-containing protein [Spirochaetota bacterium]